MKIIRWNSNEEVDLRELEASLRKEGLQPFLWKDRAGAFYPTHSHRYTEIRWILEGSITFGVDGEEVTLNPGDRLELPAGTPHYAKTSHNTYSTYLCASKVL
ncbi:MAG: hypothetical protein IEMM0008_0062 [bacterium]|nr:MAG: hypothetical protein IEMM0008_0062 [bacterium]